MAKANYINCVETYKFVHNQYKTPASVYFKQPARELRCHSQKLMKQCSRTDIRKKSSQTKWSTHGTAYKTQL